jgi:hypothetical protein
MNYPTILTLTGCIALACFLVYRGCIRDSGKVRLRDVFYLGHVFILTVVLFVTVMGGYLVLTRLPTHRPFDRRLWSADPERRVEMVDDLFHRRLLDKKPASDIKELLGAPLRVFKDSLGYRMGFYLGIPKGPFCADPDFLIVDVRNGRAGRYYIKPGIPYVNNP